MLFLFTEVTDLLERSSELIRTLELINMSLREGRTVDLSHRTLEDIAGLKVQLEALLQGWKWKNTIDRIWAFGPRRSDFTALTFIETIKQQNQIPQNNSFYFTKILLC